MGSSWTGHEARDRHAASLAAAAQAVETATSNEDRAIARGRYSTLLSEAVDEGLRPSGKVADREPDPRRDPELMALQTRVFLDPVANAAQQWEQAVAAYARDPRSESLRERVRDTSATLTSALDQWEAGRIPIPREAARDVVAEFDARPRHLPPASDHNGARNPRRVQ